MIEPPIEPAPEPTAPMAATAATTPAIAAELLAALCPAILLLRVGGGVEIGSSTLVRVGPRFLLATAAHNLDDARDEEIRLVPSGRTAAAGLPFVRRSVARRGDPADVGWIELAPETVANHGLGFVELDGLGWDGDAGHATPELCFLVQGYPAERVLREGAAAGLRAMGFVTLAAGRQDGDLALLYPPPDCVRAAGEPLSAGDGDWPPHPHGISGGGIWSYPGGEPWRRRARLVGIARGWRRHRGTLHATPIERWLARVARELPELRAIVAARLA